MTPRTQRIPTPVPARTAPARPCPPRPRSCRDRRRQRIRLDALPRVMVLWCPDWPVQAAMHDARLAPDAAVALIEKNTVFASSAAARAEGVTRGLRVREAQARFPGLTVLPYDPAVDNRVFEPLIAAIEELVPGVQVLRPGMCAVRARGAARYYGGERAAGLALAGEARGARRTPARASASPTASSPPTRPRAARAASGSRIVGGGRLRPVPEPALGLVAG